MPEALGVTLNMGIRRNRVTQLRKGLNVPLATFLLSAFAFVLGTLVPVVHSRLAFTGISIQQAADVRDIRVSISPRRGSDGTVAITQRVRFSTILRIANSSKDAILLEDIAAQSFTSDGSAFVFVGAEVLAFDAKELSSEHGNLRLEETGSELSLLPLVLKSEAEQVVRLHIWYRAELGGEMASAETIWKRFESFLQREQLTITLRINGKLRDYSLRAGAQWTRNRDDTLAVSYDELLRNKLTRMKKEALDRGDPGEVRTIDAMMQELETRKQRTPSPTK